MNAAEATEYLQRQFGEQVEAARQRALKLTKERTRRLLPAYGFKLLALIGGVAVAAGPPQEIAQGIGIAIAIAVILDGVFSNHQRLLSVAAALNATNKLVNRIEHEHRIGMPGVLEIKESDPSGAARRLNDLISRLLKELGDRRQEIEDKLAEDDLRALQAVSLDEQRRAKTVGP
jgi:hypothetical protein